MGPTSKVRNFILSPILRKKFLMKLPAFVNQISPSSYSLRDKMDQRDARSGIKLRNVVVAPEKG